MSVSTTLLVWDDTIPTGTPLENVLVRVFSSDGTEFVTEGSTDEDGTVVFELEDGETYWIRFFLTGYAFPVRQTISPDSEEESNTFLVRGRDVVEHPSTTDPNLCRVSGIIVNGAGIPAQGVSAHFMLTGKPRVVGGRAMVPSKITVQSDSDGYFEFDLVRNGVYDMWIVGLDDTIYRIKVPDYEWADFTDLVWPYVASVSFDPDELELEVGDTFTVDLNVTLSNRVELPYELDNSDLVSFSDFYELTFSDETVATATAVDLSSGELVITAVAAGITTLTVTAKTGVVAEREPSVETVIVSLSITVT